MPAIALPQPHARAAAGDVAVATLRAADELAGLAPAWDALADAQTAALFQTPGWCRAAMAALAGRRSAPVPRVVAVHRDGRLALVLPLSVVRAGPLSIARSLGEPLAQYGGAIAAPGDDAALAAALAEIARWRDVDALVLRRVRADNPAGALAGIARAHVLDDRAAPFADLTRFATVEAYGAAMDRKQMRDRKRRRRRLGETHRPDFALLHGGTAAAAAAELAIAWKRDWLAWRGLSSTAFAEPVWMDILVDIVREPPEGCEPWVGVLSLDGAPAAVELGFRRGERLIAYLGAVRPGSEDLAAGKLAMEDTLARAIAAGVRIYDLLAPADPYKRAWTDATVAVADIAVPVSALGRLWLAGVEGTLKPWLRSLYAMAPVGLRRAANRGL